MPRPSIKAPKRPREAAFAGPFRAFGARLPHGDAARRWPLSDAPAAPRDASKKAFFRAPFDFECMSRMAFEDRFRLRPPSVLHGFTMFYVVLTRFDLGLDLIEVGPRRRAHRRELRRQHHRGGHRARQRGALHLRLCALYAFGIPIQSSCHIFDYHIYIHMYYRYIYRYMDTISKTSLYSTSQRRRFRRGTS